MATKKQSQLQKFKEAARELETDQSEEAFDRVLKKVVKSAQPKDDKELPKPKKGLADRSK
ncbi:hypothetical protein [Mesorhizobium sp. M0408]|uniref:hypothetical protein n=1 Tax=unclassified Mesorhizobium TaxID=325217 RepID=UPI00333C6551